MNIDELIQALDKIRDEHGNINVHVYPISWDQPTVDAVRLVMYFPIGKVHPFVLIEPKRQ